MFVFHFILYKLFRIHFPSQYTLTLLEFTSISIFIFVFGNCILTFPYFPRQNRSIRLHACTSINNTTFWPSTHFLSLSLLLTSSPAIKILASTWSPHPVYIIFNPKQITSYFLPLLPSTPTPIQCTLSLHAAAHLGCLTPKMQALSSFKISGTTYPVA